MWLFVCSRSWGGVESRVHKNPHYSPRQQAKTTRNVQQGEDLWPRQEEHHCEDTYTVVSTGEFTSVPLRLLLSGKIHWAPSRELLAKVCDSSLSHK